MLVEDEKGTINKLIKQTPQFIVEIHFAYRSRIMEKSKTQDFNSLKQFDDDPIFQKIKTKFQMINIQDSHIHENGKLYIYIP